MKLLLLVVLLIEVPIVHAQRSFRYLPESYSSDYSSTREPVLRIQEGDTVYTTSVDAVGIDKNGKKVAPRGNPLTGPFLIEGADAGDVIAVTLLNVRLNRNFATTLNTLIPKMYPKNSGMKMWRSAKLIRWHLNLEHLTGTPGDSSAQLKNLKVPLHPFVGCVGVASEGTKAANSGASGLYGGNLDFHYITTGVVVYLPVIHDGALLYLGDGHAAQGDGELNGDALETSMDFGFSVRVLKRSEFPSQTPMVENDEYLMFFGIESTLDKALQTATMHLQSWLRSKYKLSDNEISQVIGPAVQYRIPKIAASKVEVVAMMPKKVLNQLQD
jgi:amidase